MGLQLTQHTFAGSSCASLYDILEGGLGVEVTDETKENQAEVVEKTVKSRICYVKPPAMPPLPH